MSGQRLAPVEVGQVQPERPVSEEPDPDAQDDQPEDERPDPTGVATIAATVPPRRTGGGGGGTAANPGPAGGGAALNDGSAVGAGEAAARRLGRGRRRVRTLWRVRRRGRDSGGRGRFESSMAVPRALSGRSLQAIRAIVVPSA